MMTWWLRIDWRGFGQDIFMRFPRAPLHYARPDGNPLCDSDLCHRCSVLRREWRWAR